MDFVTEATDAREADVRFENVCVRTERTYRELYQYVLFKAPRQIVATVIMAVLTCVVIGVIVVGIVGGKSVPILLWGLLAILLMYVPFFKLMPYRSYVRFAVARDAELLGGQEARLRLCATDSQIDIFAPSDEYTLVKYSTLKLAKQTRGYLLLIAYDNVIYTVDRNGFTVGTYEAFCDFLREKGIQIR